MSVGLLSVDELCGCLSVVVPCVMVCQLFDWFSVRGLVFDCIYVVGCVCYD